jgi:signal transduction histidine kinase/ActR/RegA family two-component response regulator
MDSRDHGRIVEEICRRFADPALCRDKIEQIRVSAAPESFDVLEPADGRVFERFSRTQIVDERVVGRVWGYRDITDRRRAEEERKQLLDSERSARSAAERLSAVKDEFLATLSHELRTPLSAILGWSHVLKNRTVDEAELRRALDAIERSARAQARLIEDLLDMNRITSGKVRLDIQPLQPVDIVEAAIDAIRPAADAKGIRVERILDPATGPISGDPNRLQQVMWNLLSNAIKFTPKDGKVQVVLSRVNSHIEITVADTGIGIRPEFLPLVFDRFRQADASTTRTQSGLGLGLSIVKHLVELHGGSVSVSSPGEGRGTTLTLQFPLPVVRRDTGRVERIHPSAAQALDADFRVADLSGIKVLVVDDQGDARDLMRRVLEDCGAKVLTAAAAADALVLIEKERPDLLISDIGMPEVDGFEFLRQVRSLGEERGGKTPAIALTAFARSEDRTRALRAGFAMHLSKPVEPSELVATAASVAARS